MEITPQVNLDECYLWQYDKSTNLKSLMDKKYDFYKTYVNDFLANWKEQVFAISTANDFGLDVWGMILGRARPTYTHTEDGVSQTLPISDDLYRKVLIGEIMCMNTTGSVYDLNAYLNYIFGGEGKTIYVRDFLNMSCSVNAQDTDENRFTEEEQALIFRRSIIPLPAGVLLAGSISTISRMFGFNGSELYDFNTGEDDINKQGGVFIY